MNPFLALLLACGTTDDGILDSTYLKYAEGFAPYTAPLEVVDPQGIVSHATATIIADRWALTAAHVVDDVKTATVRKNRVTRVFVNRDHFDRVFGTGDIALLQCADDFGLSYYPRLSDGDEAEGDVVSVAGYGSSGPMSVGFSAYDGRLRAGTNRIERFERALIVCHTRRRSSPMEYCIAPGDSGGPLFCKGRLAGINSITMRDRPPLRSSEGEESGHTRVSLYREWIEQVVGEGR